MARGKLPAQTPTVPGDVFIAFDFLYRYLRQLEQDVAILEAGGGGGGGGVPPTRIIATTAPLTGGGNLTVDRTLSINTFSAGASGVVPASGGGTANFLRADGLWSIPGGSSGSSVDDMLAVEVLS